MSRVKLLRLFIVRPEIVFRYHRTSGHFLSPLFASVVLQTIIAAVPGSIIFSRINIPLIFGILVIIVLSISIKTYSTSVLMKLFIDWFSSGEQKIELRGIVSSCIYCQFVLLTGKIAAVTLSIFRYGLGEDAQFTVIRFPDMSLLGVMIGLPVASIIGTIDIFTLIFLYYQTRYIRSVITVSPISAVAIALAIWILLVLLQRTIIQLSTVI